MLFNCDIPLFAKCVFQFKMQVRHLVVFITVRVNNFSLLVHIHIRRVVQYHKLSVSVYTAFQKKVTIMKMAANISKKEESQK